MHNRGLPRTAGLFWSWESFPLCMRSALALTCPHLPHGARWEFWEMQGRQTQRKTREAEGFKWGWNVYIWQHGELVSDRPQEPPHRPETRRFQFQCQTGRLTCESGRRSAGCLVLVAADGGACSRFNCTLSQPLPFHTDTHTHT